MKTPRRKPKTNPDPVPVLPSPTIPRITEPLRTESKKDTTMNPFRADRFPDLTRAIRAVTEAIGSEGDIHGGGATSPPKKRKPKADKWQGREPYVKNDRNPYTTPHKKVSEACWKGYTAKGTKRKGDRMVPDCVKEGEAVDSHTRPISEIVAPKKAGDKKKEKPDKWGGKEPYVKNDRNPYTTPHKKVDEGFAADERKAARSARVRKWMGRLKKANAADLKELPGAAGEAAHKRLHKTIGGILKGKEKGT